MRKSLAIVIGFASPKSSPKERTLATPFIRTLSFGEGRVRRTDSLWEAKQFALLWLM
jgi:hypothetical protein